MRAERYGVSLRKSRRAEEIKERRKVIKWKGAMMEETGS